MTRDELAELRRLQIAAKVDYPSFEENSAAYCRYEDAMMKHADDLIALATATSSNSTKRAARLSSSAGSVIPANQVAARQRPRARPLLLRRQ